MIQRFFQSAHVLLKRYDFIKLLWTLRYFALCSVICQGAIRILSVGEKSHVSAGWLLNVWDICQILLHCWVVSSAGGEQPLGVVKRYFHLIWINLGLISRNQAGQFYSSDTTLSAFWWSRSSFGKHVTIKGEELFAHEPFRLQFWKQIPWFNFTHLPLRTIIVDQRAGLERRTTRIWLLQMFDIWIKTWINHLGKPCRSHRWEQTSFLGKDTLVFKATFDFWKVFWISTICVLLLYYSLWFFIQ